MDGQFLQKNILCFTCCLINCSFEQTLALIAHFGWPLLKFSLKQCLCVNQQNNSVDMISITKFYAGVIILVVIIPISVTFEIKTSDS